MASKKEIVIKAVKDIIAQLKMKLTLRQIYYQLVSKAIIPNCMNEYKGLSRVLVDARKTGAIEFDDMEDRTRSYSLNYKHSDSTIESEINNLVQYIRFNTFKLPRSQTQTKLHIIGLEKSALETFFSNAIPKDSNTMLMVCHGYNSTSQLHEISEAIKELEYIKEVHVSYFGDHDPTGHDIPRNFKDQMEKDFGITFASFERIAVLPAQITQYHLPTAPAKAKDSRTASWDSEGVDCVEVDAIPPPVLKQLVEIQVLKYWDEDLARQVDAENVKLNIDYRKQMLEKIKEEFGD